MFKKIKIISITLLSILAIEVQAASHIDIQDCRISFFGVKIEDRVVRDGSCNQFSGTTKKLTVTLGIFKNRLDSPIKRVGFKGVVKSRYGEEAILIEKTADDEYNNSLWDITFTIYRQVVWSTIDPIIKGAFFVETANGTFYWLKNNYRDDYVFDRDSLPRLSLYDNACN